MTIFALWIGCWQPLRASTRTFHGTDEESGGAMQCASDSTHYPVLLQYIAPLIRSSESE